MKRALLQILLAMCFVPSQAQYSSSDINYSSVKWSDRKLRFDDFKAIKPVNAKTASRISVYGRMKSQKKKVDNIKYNYYTWDNFMFQFRSWMDAESMTETRLKHCQNQFDLYEVMLRKLAIEYPLRNKEIYELYEDLQIRFDTEIDWMNIVTDNGNDAHAVDSIANDLAIELAKAELNPKDMAEGYVPIPFALMYDFGVLTQVLPSDYISMSCGFSLGCGMVLRNILIGGDLDVSFGKWKKHVDDPKGVIGKDALLINGGLTGYLGYNVYDSKKLSLTPFIGLGLRSVNGGEKCEEYREKNKSDKVDYSSFSFGAGVMFDFKFGREIDFRNRTLGVETDEKSIRVKPYLSFTRYGNGIGWTPALNVCVGVNLKAFWMKKKE